MTRLIEERIEYGIFLLNTTAALIGPQARTLHTLCICELYDCAGSFLTRIRTAGQSFIYVFILWLGGPRQGFRR